MTPTFLLAELFAESSATNVGRSALPGAPVRPQRPRRRPLRWVAARVPVPRRRIEHTPVHRPCHLGGPATTR